MKTIITLTLGTLLFLMPTKLLAWGMIGHRVVAEVAAQHLTEEAKAQIKEILGFRSMAEVSNWMDDIKSDPNPDLDTLRAYHYVSIPDDLTYAESNKNPKGDVVKGLLTSIEKLKDKSLSREEKEIYLKMLIHFVGDIHQPLHVGRGEDAGGNAIKVKWFGKSSNLHKVWDSDILDGKLYSYTELTNIINHPTEQEVRQWQSDDFDVWIADNIATRPGVYDFDADERYWEYKYMYTNWPVIKIQLLKGGVRLAGLLNEIFAS